MSNLINKLIERIFPNGKDEFYYELKEHHDNFLKRIKSYGFNSVEEYVQAGRNMYDHIYNRSARYPVTCDC